MSAERNQMLKESHAIFEELVQWRRDFHSHPELGFTENRTAGIVANELERMGFTVKRGIGKTGVIADIGSGNGPTIAIRADMDALPIYESNDRDYASLNPGIMHACGHDSHTAMALGAASILAKKNIEGRVRFIFQPSEEAGDKEGISGAPRMIEDGALEQVDMIIAQHVDPRSPVGTISIPSGPVSGGVDNWYGRIYGVGGHGAHPDQTIDPFFILGHVIIAINAIVSRRINPFKPVVVSIGMIKGGFTENVIPEVVEVSGTLRYTDSSILPQIKDEIKRAFEVSRNFGGNYDLRFEFGGGPNINHESSVKLLRKAGKNTVGEENLLPGIPTLGAEDFGAFTEVIPGAMFTLGTLIDGDERMLHHPRFDIDERAMPIGTAVLVETVMEFFSKVKK